MTKKVSLILHNLREVFYIDKNEPITIKNQPEKVILQNFSIVINNGKITDVVDSKDVLKKYKASKILRCDDFVATPGFVDSHTHLAFAGSREDEWEQKTLGKDYIAIAKEGGGILNTVSKTRKATEKELINNIQYLVKNILNNGTTTVEIKSGYGLDFDNEIKLLKAINVAKSQSKIKIIPTLLAAHAVPPEYKNNKIGYIKLITDKIIPYTAKNNLAEFCDIFVEEGFYTLSDAKEILECAKKHSLKLKMHIYEFTHTNAVNLAINLNVTSLEHLVYTTPDDATKLANSNIICVLLPTTYFYTKKEYFNYGKMLWDKGVKIAIATDANPGTSMCFSMIDVIRLATLIYKIPLYTSLIWATHNASFAIDKQNSCGRIAKGLPANVLVWHAPSIKYIFYTAGLKLLKYSFIDKAIFKF